MPPDEYLWRSILALVGVVLLLLVVALTSGGCTSVQQGPPIPEILPLTAPEPVPTPVPPPIPATVPGPAVAPQQFRAWVPPQVTAAGDRIEGHWAVISLTPPPAETLEPTKMIPRTPRQVLPAKASPTPIARPQPADMPTPVLPGQAPLFGTPPVLAVPSHTPLPPSVVLPGGMP